MLALTLAVSIGISGYDAEFVALAEMLNVKLVTADQPLAQRCPGRVVLLDDFIK